MVLVSRYGKLTTEFDFEPQFNTYAEFLHSYRQFPKTSLEVEALARMLMCQTKMGE